MLGLFFLGAISLGRVVVPFLKIVKNLPRTYEKLLCKGEPYRFISYPSLGTHTQTVLLYYSEDTSHGFRGCEEGEPSLRVKYGLTEKFTSLHSFLFQLSHLKCENAVKLFFVAAFLLL